MRSLIIISGLLSSSLPRTRQSRQRQSDALHVNRRRPPDHRANVAMSQGEERIVLQRKVAETSWKARQIVPLPLRVVPEPTFVDTTPRQQIAIQALRAAAILLLRQSLDIYWVKRDIEHFLSWTVLVVFLCEMMCCWSSFPVLHWLFLIWEYWVIWYDVCVPLVAWLSRNFSVVSLRCISHVFCIVHMF